MLVASAPVMLADCRRAGTLCGLPLHELASRGDAETFQAAAIRALPGEACGYKIGATSAAVQRLLHCSEPFHAPLLRHDVLTSGSRFEVPAGLLGVECEFARFGIAPRSRRGLAGIASPSRGDGNRLTGGARDARMIARQRIDPLIFDQNVLDKSRHM